MGQSSDPFRSFQNIPQAAELLKDSSALNALLDAPETHQLMELLNRQGGEALQHAAQAAAGGRPDDLMALLSRVMESRDGARTVEQLRKKAER